MLAEVYFYFYYLFFYSLINFNLKLIIKNPEIQEKVYQEIQTVIGDREPHNDDFPSLKYTSCFLKEVQRLYPTASAIVRLFFVFFYSFFLRKNISTFFSTKGKQRKTLCWENMPSTKEQWL